ncbi:hypothetical protein [Pseudoflavonifractor hominis]|uniref:hypothetical protein n=1 Tax=Pseudoflavonifractor hominis TaxID=2763059 RepID=UPI001A9B78D0|nr:hypothetical protein [Pseudoflavonifractor hominis]
MERFGEFAFISFKTAICFTNIISLDSWFCNPFMSKLHFWQKRQDSVPEGRNPWEKPPESSGGGDGLAAVQ